MMRKFFATALLSALALAMWTSPNQVKAQGGVIVDLYYGLPNFGDKGLRNAISEEFSAANLSSGGFGPIGGRLEFKVSRRIGLGVDVMYANNSISFTDDSGEGPNFSYDVDFKRPRVLGRLNFHLGGGRFFDPYFVVGLGYDGSNANVSTDDPGFNLQDLNLPFDFPVAARAGFGMRVMLLKFVGINAEIGLGGPWLTGGLSFKI